MIEGEYEPPKADWVREQIEAYEASGGTEANTLRDTGIPVIIVTMRGAKSGKVRKIALMRVEHEGSYALIASKGGAPDHPDWYHNLVADNEIMIQDGPEPFLTSCRLVSGDERAQWFERGVSVFPNYADYQVKAAEAEREIPVFISEPAAG